MAGQHAESPLGRIGKLDRCQLTAIYKLPSVRYPKFWPDSGDELRLEATTHRPFLCPRFAGIFFLVDRQHQQCVTIQTEPDAKMCGVPKWVSR